MSKPFSGDGSTTSFPPAKNRRASSGWWIQAWISRWFWPSTLLQKKGCAVRNTVVDWLLLGRSTGWSNYGKSPFFIAKQRSVLYCNVLYSYSKCNVFCCKQKIHMYCTVVLYTVPYNIAREKQVHNHLSPRAWRHWLQRLSAQLHIFTKFCTVILNACNHFCNPQEQYSSIMLSTIFDRMNTKLLK